MVKIYLVIFNVSTKLSRLLESEECFVVFKQINCHILIALICFKVMEMCLVNEPLQQYPGMKVNKVLINEIHQLILLEWCKFFYDHAWALRETILYISFPFRNGITKILYTTSHIFLPVTSALKKNPNLLIKEPRVQVTPVSVMTQKIFIKTGGQLMDNQKNILCETHCHILEIHIYSRVRSIADNLL